MSDHVDVRHDPADQKYEAFIRDDLVGLVVYQTIGDHIVITHAAVQEEHRGHGIGTELIGSVLDDIQTLGKPIHVTCPVVRAFIDRHPQYQSLRSGW